MRLPREYVDRDALYAEIHARPSDSLVAPLQVSYMALLSPMTMAAVERAHVAALAGAHGVAPPLPDANHFSAAFGGFRLKWERHSEFARYTVIVNDGSDAVALERLPEAWVASLAGELIVAVHCSVRGAEDEARHESELLARFKRDGYVGTRLAGGCVTFYADFLVGADRFSRYLAFDRGTTANQLGRVLQRLLEVHTYWLLALRGLPVARALDPYLDERESVLHRVNRSLSEQDGRSESDLLAELIRLEAEISGRASVNAYRFGASRAYYGLVRQRLAELREERLPGLQTLTEFTERRLEPAMRTCETAEERQMALLERVSRATQLLATRVSIGSELQTHEVLRSMDRRTQMQLRLQQTVEGLSVAAITYYVVGLVAYAAQGLARAGAPLSVDVVTGASIPLVAVLVWSSVRRIRRAVESES